jgi:hypothetical protein
MKEARMTRRIRRTALFTALTLAGVMLLATRPAEAQGPYGRNSYEDFPFNQGSLFYRPLKPKPKPRVAARPVAPPAMVAPRAGYTYAQPYYYYQNGRYYYYYPTYPGQTQTYQAAPTYRAPMTYGR